jgi:hypothetical protein
VLDRQAVDKITDEFRRLFRCRQYAFRNGETERYPRLRNKVNRMSKQLRQRYYRNNIQNLCNSNPFNWWRETKRLTGQVSKLRPELSALANCEAGGDIQRLANLINSSLQHVSSDLSPLSDTAVYEIEPISPEYIIHPYEVFRKLSQIKTRKSPGPDGIPNWFFTGLCLCHFRANMPHLQCLSPAWNSTSMLENG